MLFLGDISNYTTGTSNLVFFRFRVVLRCPVITLRKVFFYPKDSTPGCTKEVCTFQSDLDQYKKLGAEVIGISSDADHTAFVKENDLSFTLLSDIGGQVITPFARLRWGGGGGGKLMRASHIPWASPLSFFSGLEWGC